MTSVDSLKYKCTVCLKKLFPPVFQCTNGHLFCKNCITKFEKCATCTVSMTTDPQRGKIRNREVEKIIRDYQTHECPSPKCAKRMKLEDLAEHRPKCVHRTAKYCSFLKISGCEEKVSLAELSNHLQTKHQAMQVQFYRNTPARFMVRLPGRRDRPSVYVRWIQSQTTGTRAEGPLLEGEDFLFILMVSLRQGSIFWTPFIVGCDTLADRCKCEIDVFPNDKIPRAKLSCTWNTIYSPANKNWSLTHSFAVALEKLRSMALPLTKAGISESRIDDTDWDDAYGEDESIEEVEGEKEKSGGNEEEDDNDSRDHGSSSDGYWVEIRFYDAEKNRTYSFKINDNSAGGAGIERSSPQNQTPAKQVNSK